MDWAVEIPEDLYRGLIYAVPTASWREAIRSQTELRARLRGFRPETVPVREIDRIVLKALTEDVKVREAALERFSEENRSLLSALAALGPEAALAQLDDLLKNESAARIFWAASARDDGFLAVRDAVLARVRGGKLPDGATLLPARLERRPSSRAPAVAEPGAGEEEKAAPVDPAVVDSLAERLRRSERELARSRDDRARLAERAAALEAEVGRLEGERARLERALEETRGRAEAASRAGAAGALLTREAVAGDPQAGRLAAALEDAEHRAAQAVQRSRMLKRELDQALERLEYFESTEVKPAYPREPAGVSPRAPEEKVAWPADEHHYPRRLEPFLARIARAQWVDRIAIRDFLASTETRVKSVDERGNIFLQYSDGEKAVRLYLTTSGKDANEGLWIADRLRELEPSIS